MVNIRIIKSLLLSFFVMYSAVAAEPIEITRYENEHSSATLIAVRFQDDPAVAAKFTGTDDLHYYADPETAPAPDLILNAEGQAAGVSFGPVLFPEPDLFFDASLNKEIEVYVGDFYLILPITSGPDDIGLQSVSVQLSGIACTSKLCLPPFEMTLSEAFDFSGSADWPVLDVDAAKRRPAGDDTTPGAVAASSQVSSSTFEIGMMLLLATLAGLSFNIMPCVLPVLPLIASRMVNIAKERASRRIALGLTFCVGIVAFFVAVGLFASLVRLTTGAVFNLSDPFRYPVFNIVMTLFLVLFALFMFDLFSLSLPGSISGKTADTSTFGGSLGMGFLAAILSIPCSGAILAAVLIWVQAQHWLMGFWAFLLMGIGMALPYAAIVLSPQLLGYIPRPGNWMDQFKKAMGFAILLLAVKPLSGLPKERALDVLFYAIILGFVVWMWGTWVTYSTPTTKKWLVRGIAALLAVISGMWLLPETKDMIDWQDYDRTAIQRAIADDQPVLLKFTADWCTNCKILEARVFRDTETAEALRRKNVFAVKADTTRADMPAAVDLQERYGIPGTVPMTLIHLPGRDEVIRLSGIYGKGELFEALDTQ